MAYKNGEKEYRREYNQRPKIKAQQKAYRSTPEYKARHNASHSTPEYKEKRNEYARKYRLEHLEESRARSKKYKETHKEERKEYTKNHYQNNKDKIKEYHKEYNSRPETKEKIRQRTKLHKEDRRHRVRNSKIQALGTIAKYHNSEIECWRCHEKRLWVLTIGHINQNGKEDRKAGLTCLTKYIKIANGERSCEDLQVECMNCNSCLQWYGKYPDEMTEIEFRMMDNEKENV